MADGFETHEMKDGRVLVILHPSCAITREAILALLAELGVEEAAVLFVSPEEVNEHCPDVDDVPVVIPIDQTICDAPELDAAGRQCGDAGGRVIVVLDDGFRYQGLHPIAENYGTQCGWSAAQLRDCVKNPKSTARDSDGAKVNHPSATQVKCG